MTTWPGTSIPKSTRNAFDWRSWQPRCEWPKAKQSQALVRDAISLVEGQKHELRPMPAQKGAMSGSFIPLGRRVGEVGRRKLRESK